jgi:hypothetical protein
MPASNLQIPHLSTEIIPLSLHQSTLLTSFPAPFPPPDLLDPLHQIPEVAKEDRPFFPRIRFFAVDLVYDFMKTHGDQSIVNTN